MIEIDRHVEMKSRTYFCGACTCAKNRTLPVSSTYKIAYPKWQDFPNRQDSENDELHGQI